MVNKHLDSSLFKPIVVYQYLLLHPESVDIPTNITLQQAKPSMTPDGYIAAAKKLRRSSLMSFCPGLHKWCLQ